MRNIRAVALLEIRLLFSSPIAWVALLVFSVQFGYTFSHRLEEIGVSSMGQGPFTLGIFSASMGGLFEEIQNSLYFYIPVLTMGLVSRELLSGSYKLAFSSPVSVTELVLGKYGAMVLFDLLLIGVITALTVLGSLFIPQVDAGLLFAGLLGLTLLTLAYSAIGLFVSCLTRYQVVAAIGTFVVLAFLSYIKNLWQDVAFVRGVTWFLSISDRSQNFIDGLISSRDVVYFVLIIILFLGLSMLYLKSMQSQERRTVKGLRYTALAAIVCTLGWLSQMPAISAYYDASFTKRKSVSAVTQALLSRFDEPIQVDAYANILAPFGGGDLMPDKTSELLKDLEPYQRFLKKDIDLHVHCYYDSLSDVIKNNPGKSLDELAENAALLSGLDFTDVLPPKTVEREFDVAYERGASLLRLRYKGRTAIVRVGLGFDFIGEEQVADGLKHLLDPAPTLVFLTGHGERTFTENGDRDYNWRFRDAGGLAFFNLGFYLTACTPDQVDGLDTSSILIIADPTKPFDAADTAHLNGYVRKGGKAWVLGDAARKEIIRPLIQPLGIGYVDGTLIQEHEKFGSDYILMRFSPEAARLDTNIDRLAARRAIANAHNVGALSYTVGEGIQPFLLSDDSTGWMRVGKVLLDTGKVKFDPSKGDKKQSYPVAVSIERKVGGRDQRLLVFSDGGIPADSGPFNRAFALECIRWLGGCVFPLNLSHPPVLDTKCTLDRPVWKQLNIWLLFVLPLLIVGYGCWFIFSRLRR